MSKKRKIIITCVILIFLIILPIVYYCVPNEDIKSILLGVISSVIASSIFYIFSVVAFENKNDEINTLNNMITVMEKMKTKGVIDLRARSDYESDFWINFAENANKEWIISGRTLNRWLEKEIKDDFLSNFIRILNNNGEIILVIYNDVDGEEKKEKEILKEFLKKEIFPKCIKRRKGKYVQKNSVKLKIYEIDRLTYLYNANENEIIVAPYFTHVDNNNNIMFVLKRSSKQGNEYSRDFQHILEKDAQKNVWLNDYIVERNNDK